MEIKDVKLSINVKSNKVTKILHLLFTDAIADFQSSHPKSVPSLLAALKKGDTEKAVEKVDQFLDLVEELRDSVANVRKHIIDTMPGVFTDEERGGKKFIDPDGNVIHKLSEAGDKSIVAGPSSKKSPVKKKAPAKKRATKKKAKKEE